MTFAVQGQVSLALMAGGCVVISITTLMLLRRGLPAVFLAPVMPVVLLATMTVASLRLGGVHSPITQALLIIPILTWFLAGRRSGLIAAVAVTTIFVTMAWYDPVQDQAATVLRLVSLITANGIIYLIARTFATAARETLQALDNANIEITDTNADLVAARDAAERALAARSALLAAVSHEIRTPMTSIIGVTDLLLDTAPTTAQREYIDIIRRSGESLITIMNDLLDFTKIDAGRLALETIDFDLHSTINESVALMAVQTRQRDIHVMCTIHPEVPNWINGDPIRLRQILLNLLSNAIKFTERGEIALRVRPAACPEHKIVLHFEIQDPGVGMTPEQQAQVFTPFTQAERSTARHYGGTGLGLSICQQLVHLMGGKIGVHSELGQGSLFWFTIHAGKVNCSRESIAQYRSDIAVATTESDHGTSAPLAPIRALLAEDNLVSQKIAKALLEKLNCRVDVASTGQEAVNALTKSAYDIVFMDCQMPEMDGLEATAAIRRLHGSAGQTPVIAMTANVMPGDRERCLAAGMDGYVSKPVKRRELAAIMAQFSQTLAPDRPTG